MFPCDRRSPTSGLPFRSMPETFWCSRTYAMAAASKPASARAGDWRGHRQQVGGPECRIVRQHINSQGLPLFPHAKERNALIPKCSQRQRDGCRSYCCCGNGSMVFVLLWVGFSPGTWDMVFVRLCSPSSVTLVLVCDLLNVPLSMA